MEDVEKNVRAGRSPLIVEMSQACCEAGHALVGDGPAGCLQKAGGSRAGRIGIGTVFLPAVKTCPLARSRKRDAGTLRGGRTASGAQRGPLKEGNVLTGRNA